MLFTDYPLDDRLQRALVRAGFVTPTPIQAAALPVVMEGRDIVGTAQTGTGKTAAFVLPILQRLISVPLEARKTRVIILAPTRELVEQILAVVRELGIHTNVRAIAVYGGVAMHPQTRALRNGVELVIACPGRLLDHIKRGNVDLRHIDCLVLDEADRMLDMGFMPAIQEIIDHLPTSRQTLLFSATFARELNAFVAQTLHEPVRVEVDTAVPAQTVHHILYQVKAGMKPALITALLQKIAHETDSVLIFTKTRVTANEVGEYLNRAGLRADVLHAEKTQRARQDTLDDYRSGIYPYLVATDIAARGIDVTSISHVINYDLPTNADDYLHRIGRTGRMERTGHAISFVTRSDMRALREIERMLGKRIQVARPEEVDSRLTSIAPTSACGGRDTTSHGIVPISNRPVKSHHVNAGPYMKTPSHMPADNMPGKSERTHRRREERLPEAGGRRAGADVGYSDRKRVARPEYGDRQKFDATPKPGRRNHPPTVRREDAPSAVNARSGHGGGKPFTGMASTARYARKNAPGKRQPGEISATPRPHGKSGIGQQEARAQAPRKKRASGRRR